MMTTPVLSLTVCHTWSGQAVTIDHQVEVRLHATDDHLVIEVNAPYLGDPPAPVTPPGPTDQLWESEVVELFIAGADDHYTEVELGPMGHHLVLQLHGTRNAIARCLALDYQSEIHGPRWTGTARLDRTRLPAGPHRINVTAVHGTGPNRRYLSMVPLPGDEPDFHQLDSFAPVTLPDHPPLSAPRDRR